MLSMFSSWLLLIALAGHARSATYSQSDSHQGSGFLKSFSVQAIADPTHGRVNYVGEFLSFTLPTCFFRD